MESGMIELAKQIGRPAMYLVLSLILLVWGAQSYVGLRKTMSQDYRENVLETIKVIDQLQSATKNDPELEPIKGELLRQLGVVDRILISDGRTNDSPLNAFLAPEPMLVIGAASSLVLIIANSLGFFIKSISRRYVALALSCILALAVFKEPVNLFIGAIYYILIATAIYAMAVGLNEQLGFWLMPKREKS
jgi:hypothetical protein